MTRLRVSWVRVTQYALDVEATDGLPIAGDAETPSELPTLNIADWWPPVGSVQGKDEL